MINTKLSSCLVFSLLVGMLFSSCENSVDPMIVGGKEYSVYGPLDIEESVNFIRVHDNKTLLNAENTRHLDEVNVTITNLNSGEQEVLKDSIVQFNNIYTHNFRIDMPIEYDTEYRIELEDEEGFHSSLTSVTTRRSELTILKDSVTCTTPFQIELTNFDFQAGEQMDVEVSANIGSKWLSSNRVMGRTIDTARETITYHYTPNFISEAILGQFSAIDCSEFTSDKIRAKFTHIGYMKGKEQYEEVDVDSLYYYDPAPNRQIILSKYSLETEVQIHPCEFDGNPESCTLVN